MKLIELKCPSCNANLEVNEELENVTCNYCGNKFKIEDENATKEERIIKALGKQKEKERKYYASEDYEKRLNIEANANDKSIIGSIGRQIQKNREYMASDEYKKRKAEETKEQKKALIVLVIVFALSIVMITIPFLFSSKETTIEKDDITCKLNKKEYVITMELQKEIKCPACSKKMLNEFNDKYLDKESIEITKKNIKSYFNNNNGECTK